MRVQEKEKMQNMYCVLLTGSNNLTTSNVQINLQYCCKSHVYFTNTEYTHTLWKHGDKTKADDKILKIIRDVSVQSNTEHVQCMSIL